jgi:hypothetical protein
MSTFPRPAANEKAAISTGSQDLEKMAGYSKTEAMLREDRPRFRRLRPRDNRERLHGKQNSSQPIPPGKSRSRPDTASKVIV